MYVSEEVPRLYESFFENLLAWFEDKISFEEYQHNIDKMHENFFNKTQKQLRKNLGG